MSNRRCCWWSYAASKISTIIYLVRAGAGLSPTNKCKVSLSGGRGYLGGLHATYFDIQIISATI